LCLGQPSIKFLFELLHIPAVVDVLVIFYLFSAYCALPPVGQISPLIADCFVHELSNHPDQLQVSFVVDGLLNWAFRIFTNFSQPRKTNRQPTSIPM